MNKKHSFFAKEIALEIAPQIIVILLFIYVFESPKTALLFVGTALVALGIFIYQVRKAKLLGIDFNDLRNHSSQLYLTFEANASQKKILDAINPGRTYETDMEVPETEVEDWVYLKSIAGSDKEYTAYQVSSNGDNKATVELKSGLEKEITFFLFTKSRRWFSAIRHLKYFKKRILDIEKSTIK